MEQKTVFHDSSADGNKFYDHHETDRGIDTILLKSDVAGLCIPKTFKWNREPGIYRADENISGI